MAKKNIQKESKKVVDSNEVSQSEGDGVKVTKVTKTRKDSFTFSKKTVLAIVIPLILLLIASYFAFQVRVGPYHLDGLRDNVERSVYSQIEQIVMQQIRQQAPMLPDEVVRQEAQAQMRQIRASGMLNLNGQMVDINAEVDAQFEQMKRAFQTDDGQTYLVAIDPHFFYKITNNYYFGGHTGDTLDEDGNPLISRAVAPEGRAGTFNPEFQVWFSAVMYRLHGIDENSSYGEKLNALYFIEVIFAILSLVGVFFFIKLFGNNFSAFTGTLFFGSLSMFATRTIAGFVDTDAFTLFFPITIACLFIYALVAKTFKLSIVFASLAGFFIGLGIWAWRDNWFIVLALFGISVVYYVYLLIANYLQSKKITFTDREKSVLVSIVTLFTSGFIFTWLLAGYNLFTEVFIRVFSRLDGIAGTRIGNIWPNVLSSVAELNPASFSQIVRSLGGSWPFILALTGLLLLALKFEGKDKLKYGVLGIGFLWFIAIVEFGLFLFLVNNYELLFLILLFLPIIVALSLGLYYAQEKGASVFACGLLVAWLAGTIFMSFNGVRFILLISPAFGVSFGLFWYFVVNRVTIILRSLFDNKESHWIQVSAILLVGIVFFLMWSPVHSNALAASRGTFPSFDDAWHNAMYEIRDNSAEDAIITSWWDFGHFFHAIAERGVTFDGATQTRPQSHWVGKLFLESDDSVSEDILQMLVCGGNQAFDTMQDIANDSSGGVLVNKIIYDTLGRNNEETRAVLEQNDYFEFSSDEIDTIMEYLACENPRENFVITSQDMVSKAPVWAHWGLWDFTRKFVSDNRGRMSAEEMAEMTDSDLALIEQYLDELRRIDIRVRAGEIRRTDALNQWFSPYPQYLTPSFNNCQLSGSTVSCFDQVRIDLNDFSLTDTAQLPIKRLIVVDGDALVVYEQDREQGADILIRNIDTAPQALVAEYPHGNSLFTRLFFLDGLGVTRFEKFYDTNSVTTGRIIIWKTMWDE